MKNILTFLVASAMAVFLSMACVGCKSTHGKINADWELTIEKSLANVGDSTLLTPSADLEVIQSEKAGTEWGELIEKELVNKPVEIVRMSPDCLVVHPKDSMARAFSVVSTYTNTEKTSRTLRR